MRRVVVVLLCFAVAGCATAARKAVDAGAMWRRADCGEEGTGESSQRYALATTICRGRAQAAEISAAATVPTGYGTGGAIASGIEAGMTRVHVSDNIMISCMAEQGYMLWTEAQFQASCPAPAAAVAKRQ